MGLTPKRQKSNSGSLRSNYHVERAATNHTAQNNRKPNRISIELSSIFWGENEVLKPQK
ncbi:hypothetical protein SAMN06265368_2157 [Cohaesibacter gelatinilyticus]|uniref:Uncharacterized protein n=1 Tax=Cohaesibacter gelatinilyticus TaxID=372072 RepID=A0A285PBH3_9HYPH|nr:hypothetical protein SAMN06265368_2157 [Cohaesibacter gelatinilyticus]